MRDEGYQCFTGELDEPTDSRPVPPEVIVGGPMLLENLRRVRWDVHLMLLRDLAEPRIPFMDVGKAFKDLGIDV